jgi:hypothetical protein
MREKAARREKRPVIWKPKAKHVYARICKTKKSKKVDKFVNAVPNAAR